MIPFLPTPKTALVSTLCQDAGSHIKFCCAIPTGSGRHGHHQVDGPAHRGRGRRRGHVVAALVLAEQGLVPEAGLAVGLPPSERLVRGCSVCEEAAEGKEKNRKSHGFPK